jgi:uncharacterized tellurite resistance protein B-like protein
VYQLTVPVNESEASEINKDFNAENMGDGRLLLGDNKLIIALCKRPGGQLAEAINKDSRLAFPLEVSDRRYLPDQRPNYIKDLSVIEICHTCNGDKEVTCDDSECKGRHVYTCPNCSGKGEVGCDLCKEVGKIDCDKCGGKSRVKCGGLLGSILLSSRSRGCNGSGKISVKSSSGKTRKIVCPSCRGKGDIRCEDCSKGKVVCSKCDGRKKLTCGKCEGVKTITCSHCNTEGKILCETCFGNGQMAALYWVLTEIDNVSIRKMIRKGDAVEYSESLLEKAILQVPNAKVTYDELDATINASGDAIAENILSDIREFPVAESQEKFPRLLEERLSYNVIPVVKVNCSHVLTNNSTAVVIADVKREPSMEKLGDAMAIKNEVSTSAKSLFGKILKTKRYSEKIDRFNQIKLMIYIAKADGEIDENEKVFINEHVNNLADFTKKEKLDLLGLMSADHLPDLSKGVIVFSSKSRGLEILSSLEQLAQSDGHYHESERRVIEQVKTLM